MLSLVQYIKGIQSELQSISILQANPIGKGETVKCKTDDISGMNEDSTAPITIVVVVKAFFSVGNVCFASTDTCCVLNLCS